MLPFELDEVWEILREESPETWKVYCGTRRHMDFETCIAGITYRFNEQFFKELLTPPAIQGRHKLKPPTRKKVRHLFHRMDQLGVMIPRPDLGDLVFYYPKVAAHQSVQNMKGQRGAKEGPDETPKKPLQINGSGTAAVIAQKLWVIGSNRNIISLFLLIIFFRKMKFTRT